MPAAESFDASRHTRDDRWQRLTRVSRALTYATSLDEVLKLTVEQAAEVLRSAKSILMLSDKDGLLHVRAAYGLDEQLVDRFREPLNETLIRRLRGIVGDTEAETFLGAPLVVQGQVTGLLAVWRNETEASTESDEWLLAALADQAAVAVERARLAEEVAREEERGHAARTDGEARERALVTLSHDLRSPLNAIQSYTDLIDMEIYGPVTEGQRQALSRIRVSSRHLLSVLENVLEMSRLSAGVVTVRTSAVRVADVIDEAVQIMGAIAEDKHQTVQVANDADLQVVADAARLRQVLLNLLVNASKYTPSEGSIEIRARRAQWAGVASACVEVADDGPGIPGDQLQAIFEPYYRVASHDSEAGAGLGLAISRQLARQMSGELDVVSEVGKGSTFRIWLPVHS